MAISFVEICYQDAILWENNLIEDNKMQVSYFLRALLKEFQQQDKLEYVNRSKSND